MSRALVVDDNDRNRYLLRALLQGSGWEVDEARNGAEALMLASRAAPDVVITDLLMPGMDGYALLRHWKSDARLRNVPIIVYTATYTDPSDEKLALDLGADAFFVKPLEPDRFIERMSEVLSARKTTRAVDSTALPTDDVYLAQYNSILVHKLEDKLVQLDQANRDLAATEARLREAQDRLDLAVNAGKVGLWDWDLRTDKVHFSKEWKRQIGYTEGEISDEFNEWECRLHPEDRERAFAVVQAYLETDDPDYESEFRLRHKDGSYRYILARASEVRDADGARKRLVGSHVDLTEYKELQTQLLQSQKMESIGQLAGGVAHDFNNLLTVINGTAELALNKLRADDPLAAYFREIHAAGERAATLTRQLLIFSRRRAVRPETIDLNTVVSDVQGMLRRLIAENVQLVVRPASGLGFVRADAGQLEQVLVNLVVNARDAMLNGGAIMIETANVTLDEAYATEHLEVAPGPYVLLAVSDTGVGMDAATRSRIFEPFFTTKDPGHGTGLGLSTVYGIVRQSGGSIWVYSEPGVGTTFKIYLPQVSDGAPMPASRRPTSITRGNETILVVEDAEPLRRLMTEVLESAGYRVLPASSGSQALELLEHYGAPVQLVISDVVMPGMSGYQLAARLMHLRPELKVLLTSGYAAPTGAGSGTVTKPLLAKPYTVAELTGKVREVLDAP